MFLEVYFLYEVSQKGDDVFVFVWLLFVRDILENLEFLFKNYINFVGDLGGLEQVSVQVGLNFMLDRVKKCKFCSVNIFCFKLVYFVFYYDFFFLMFVCFLN